MSYRVPTRRLPTGRAVADRMLRGMYRYRCGQCATTSPVVRTRVEIEHERDRHRRIVHGGHRPDGEHLQRHRQPVQPVTLVALALVALAVIIAAL